ncbi:MAG: hypothetical protein AAFZ92_06140, partial [Pseudomonadota bacterium]
LIASSNNDGTFYVEMKRLNKYYRLYVRLDQGYELVAYDHKPNPTFLSLFSAGTLNQDNLRVSWYTHDNAKIARSDKYEYDGQEIHYVLFDETTVDNRDSRRWNFFIRDEDNIEYGHGE